MLLSWWVGEQEAQASSTERHTERKHFERRCRQGALKSTQKEKHFERKHKQGAPEGTAGMMATSPSWPCGT
eukprot:scaffold18446_cov20-Tisochrysis_lutea.AAC.3